MGQSVGTMATPGIKFNYTLHEIASITKKEIKLLNQSIGCLAQIPLKQVTFKNCARKLSLCYAQSQESYNVIAFLHEIATDPKIREASRLAEQKINSSSVSVEVKNAILIRLNLIKQREYDNLDLLDKLLLNHLLTKYQQPSTKIRREYLCKLYSQENILTAEFDKNLAENKIRLLLPISALIGCSQHFLKRTHKKNGLYQIMANYNDVKPVLDNCQIATTRKLVRDMYDLRSRANLEILEKLHQVRTNIAQCHGYKYSSNHQLKEETINTSQKVVAFLDQILSLLQPTSQAYIQELIELRSKEIALKYDDVNVKNKKRKRVSDENSKLKSYDISYYRQKYLQQNYNLNHDELAEYFPMDHVLKEMMNFYAEIFHLKFVAMCSPEGYDELSCYQIYDQSTGKCLGHFYLDLYPRAGKFTHFAVWNLIGGYRKFEDEIYDKDVQVLPVSIMVGNFPKLLQHSNVSTLFHEFGHLLHDICGGYKNRYYNFSGLKVETDFVEIPSQMKEQWVWDAQLLKRISQHYQTGEKLTDKMIETLISTRFVGVSLEWTEVAVMAKIDQLIHSREKISSAEMMYLASSVFDQHLDQDDALINLADWGHINGYNSLYYSYVWTMAIAVDLFTKFKDNPFDQKIGLEYRQKIMEPGATKDAWEMIHDFLNREPNLSAFLENYIGLKNVDKDNLDLDLAQHLKKKRKL